MPRFTHRQKPAPATPEERAANHSAVKMAAWGLAGCFAVIFGVAFRHPGPETLFLPLLVDGLAFWCGSALVLRAVYVTRAVWPRLNGFLAVFLSVYVLLPLLTLVVLGSSAFFFRILRSL